MFLTTVVVWVLVGTARGAPEYHLNFSRTWNRFNWTHRFNFNPRLGEKLSISSSFGLSSTLHRMKEGDRWQDNSSSNISLSYPLSERFRLSVNVSTTKRKDDLSRNRRPILTQRFSSSISWKPLSILRISQSTGGTSDSRMGVKDRGMTYSTNFSLSPELGGNWRGSFSFSKSGNTLKRKDKNMSINASLRYSGWIEPSLNFSESRQLRKYYRMKRERRLLESIRNRSRNISVSFSPIKFLGLKLSELKGSYSYRKMEDSASKDSTSAKFGSDRKVSSWKLEGGLSWSLLGGRLPMSYKVYYERELWDAVRYSLDKFTRDLHMVLQAGLGISPSDSMTAFLSSEIRRIDTPDPKEYNDWDHLTHDLRLSYSHSSEGLRLTCTFTTHHSHTVYLSSKRSAGNNRSRQYSISADLSYKVWKASLSQRYEIGADYKEYDYDDPESPKSTVTRRASASVRFTLPLGKLSLGGNYNFRTGDSGAWYKQRRLQVLTREEASHTFGISCSYPLASYVPFSFSYSWNRRRQSTTGRPYISGSRGFRTSVGYAPGGSNSLNMNLSRTVQRWGREKVRWNVTMNFTHKF